MSSKLNVMWAPWKNVQFQRCQKTERIRTPKKYISMWRRCWTKLDVHFAGVHRISWLLLQFIAHKNVVYKLILIWRSLQNINAQALLNTGDETLNC